MEKGICRLCNKEFTKKRSNQVYCQMPHNMNCAICGKSFQLKRAVKNRTEYACSKECTTKLIKKTNLKRYGAENPFASEAIKEKIKKSNLEKYGVEYAAQRDEVKEKQKETMMKRYGVRSPLQDPTIKERQKQTNLERYGVDNPAKTREVQEKIQNTNLQKYGVSHVFQADEVKDKIKKLNLEKYGTECPRWYNEESRLKAEATNLDKYGAKNPFGSKEIQDKIKQDNISKYGVPWITQVEDVKDKMKETLLKNYGVNNPGKSEIVKERIRKTSLEKYGAPHYMQSEEGKKAFEELLLNKYDVKNYSHCNISNYEDYLDLENFLSNTSKSITELCDYFNLPRRSMRRRIKELNLEGLFDDFYVGESLGEYEFEKFLNEHPILKDIKYIRNDRSILEGKELDFYFPEHNLAVEISPTYTHNSKVGWANKGEGVSSTYHLDKFLNAEKKNVELMTIFDWHDWDKVLKMIEIKLMGANNICNGRDTKYIEYKKINPDIFEKLSEWHILSLPSNYRRTNTVSVLEIKGEIVGIALWEDNGENKDVVELKRMVFKPGTVIRGGASKLIKNYIRNNESLREIFTFSDCDLGTGNVYKTIGFELETESKPVLTYYNIKHKKHIKHLSLVRQGADRLLANFPKYEPVGVGEGLPSNREIVESYGFLPVYDCGYRKWRYKIER